MYDLIGFVLMVVVLTAYFLVKFGPITRVRSLVQGFKDLIRKYKARQTLRKQLSVAKTQHQGHLREGEYVQFETTTGEKLLVWRSGRDINVYQFRKGGGIEKIEVVRIEDFENG